MLGNTPKLDLSKLSRPSSGPRGLPSPRSLGAALGDLAAALSEVEWAYTGSYALSLWAQRAGVPFRPPNDIDIVVGDYASACDAIGGYEGGSTFEIVNRGAKGDGTKVEHKALGFGIDVIAAGTRLGTLEEVDKASFAGYPVVGLNALIGQLENRGASGSEDLAVAKRVRENLKA